MRYYINYNFHINNYLIIYVTIKSLKTKINPTTWSLVLLIFIILIFYRSLIFIYFGIKDLSDTYDSSDLLQI